MNATTMARPGIALLAAASLITGLFLATAAQAEVPSDDVPDELKTAIEGYITDEGHEYAGFCRDIEQSEHHGEYCVFVLSMTETEATVSYGAVASDEMEEVTFAKEGTTWTTETDTTPTATPTTPSASPTPAPPETGSGGGSEGGSGAAYTIAIIILAGAALAGVTATTQARRR